MSDIFDSMVTFPSIGSRWTIDGGSDIIVDEVELNDDATDITIYYQQVDQRGVSGDRSWRNIGEFMSHYKRLKGMFPKDLT